MPDLRRQRRVACHTNMRLRSPGREQSVVARVQNLSPSGVFVTAADLPKAGTEVQCRLLVAGERCTLKGLVAWVRPPGTEGANDVGPGAGIQFLDVGHRASALLARLIRPSVNDRQAVDVWFEGMAAPTRSHATISDDSLSISTKLPFLRLDSPVKVSFVRRGVEEVRSGTLEAVTLEPSAEDGIPRLRLTVSTPQPDSAYGTIEVREPAPGSTTPEAEAVGVPRTVIDPMHIETPKPVVMAPSPPSAPSPGAMPEARGLDPDRTQRLVLAEEPVVQPPPRAEPKALPLRLTTPIKLGLAAGAVVSVGTLVALLSSGTPSTGNTEKAAKITSAPGDSQAAQMASEARPSRFHPVVVVQAAATAAEESLPIAIIGSVKGMQTFKLAEPPGLAINLPHAYPRPGVGPRLPNGVFRKLVVQRKGVGSQVRLYFTSDQSPEVTAEDDAIRVTLKAKGRPKRSGRRT